MNEHQLVFIKSSVSSAQKKRIFSPEEAYLQPRRSVPSAQKKRPFGIEKPLLPY